MVVNVLKFRSFFFQESDSGDKICRMVLKPVAFKDDMPVKFKMVKVCRIKPTTPPPTTTTSMPTTTYCYRYIGTLCIPSWDGYIM